MVYKHWNKKIIRKWNKKQNLGFCDNDDLL